MLDDVEHEAVELRLGQRVPRVDWFCVAKT
jgi:hypothetical protein